MSGYLSWWVMGHAGRHRGGEYLMRWERWLIRRFLKKNFLIQDVGTGLIKMSYLGNAGWRFNRFSTACIATFPSEIPFW